MAINIISGNLNEWGDQGRYETDPSTWGYNLSIYGNLFREFLSFEGLYSQRFVPFSNFVLGSIPVAQARSAALVNGRKYLLRARVFVLNGSPIAPDTCEFSWDNPIIGFVSSETRRTVLEARTSWVEVEARFTKNLFVGNEFTLSLLQINGANNVSILSPAFVDKVEIFEYEDVPVVCSLDGTISTTNASGPANPDGTATITVTAGIPGYEYSKDNGATWQGSNFFSGLLSGVYTFKIREVGNNSCQKTLATTINSASAAFDWSFVKQDESVSGAADGSIAITPTVVDVYTFSKDSGVTFQAGNLFSNLAAGAYNVVVKKTSDNTIVGKSITIAPGAVIAEKIFFSKNFITKSVQAATNWLSLTNYKLYDDVRVEDVADSGIYNSKLKVAIEPEANGTVLFQIRQAFRQLMEPVPPAYNQSAIIRVTDRIKFFKHFTGETTGTQEVPSVLTGSLPSLVIWGGVDKLSYPSLDFFGTYPTHKKFMSWAPLLKTVDPNQEDYLTFWMYKSVSTLRLKGTAYFSDGTNQTATLSSYANALISQLVQVPAGPLNSGIKLVNAAKTLVRYDLWLADGADVLLSETRSYELDAISYPNTRFFMFLNSIGGFEVMRFYGIAEQTASYGRELVQAYLATDYNPLKGEKQMGESLRVDTASHSSGYFQGANGKAWLEYMKDFLGTTQLFELKGTQRLPLVITGGSLSVEDKNYEYAFQFEVESGFNNTSYT
jgi:hypothetical protein